MAKGKKQTRVAATRELSDRQKLFVAEYLIDLNATAAYKRAGYKCAGKTAETAAGQVFRNIQVQAAIKAAQDKLAGKLDIAAEKVVERLWCIATADPNELIEFRRTCCRYCYGRRNDFQRTKGEMERDRGAWNVKLAEGAAKGIAPEPFSEMGGIGYDRRLPPKAECQECFGEGIGEAFPKDTRALSASALQLYAGVKVTREGLEMKLHDQVAALVNVGKHLGLFVNKHEHTGRDGGPIPITLVEFGRAAVSGGPSG